MLLVPGPWTLGLPVDDLIVRDSISVNGIGIAPDASEIGDVASDVVTDAVGGGVGETTERV